MRLLLGTATLVLLLGLPHFFPTAAYSTGESAADDQWDASASALMIAVGHVHAAAVELGAGGISGRWLLWLLALCAGILAVAAAYAFDKVGNDGGPLSRFVAAMIAATRRGVQLLLACGVVAALADRPTILLTWSLWFYVLCTLLVTSFARASVADRKVDFERAALPMGAAIAIGGKS